MKITLNNLDIGYQTPTGAVAVQKGISAEIRSGEFVCLLGPNGAGKTTLLRTLSGLLPPVSGTVSIDGRPLAELNRSEISRKLSIVLTERPSLSSMTVAQLIGLGRSPYTGFWGRLSEYDENIVKEAMLATGTLSLSSRLVNSLSDGECQRVMIAKAISQETPAIFLDEPTAFLDFPSKAEIMILLKNLAHSRNIAIFQSTHDLNMALALADRIWLEDKSHGIHIGTPKELAKTGLLEEYFLRPGIEFNRENMQFSIRQTS